MSQGLVPIKSGTFLFDATSNVGLRAHTVSYGTAMDSLDRPVRKPECDTIVKYTLYFRTVYKS